ncbi:TonB-dependent siderophore receptor [Granulicella paludicola]|uniref:TonB-dependent siderophore receptor n=1 Tax=Granulicella paludicola TaxID=474951 RepID=UPI0021DF7C49|nr:TonB-dependent siderophore receptor [Granulicella paludicola]
MTKSGNNGAIGRSRRNSLLAMAALTFAGLTARTADASARTDKDKPEAEKAPSPDATKEQSTPAQTVHHFNIPAGTLGESFAALQKETGVIFSMSKDDIGSLASSGVTGVVTLQEALTTLLTNTGVSARFEGSDRVVLSLTGDTSSVDVTAEALSSPKFTASLLDLPQTVQVVSQETMQNTASTTLMEALRTVPGITFGAGEGGSPLGDRPFIRGMDSQSSIYVDGIRDIAAQSREVFDVQSIEVQEGPGGAYGGRGTGGGSIDMNSKLANRNNFIAGSFMPGTSAYKRGTVDGNVKFNSLVSGRLVGMWTDADEAGRDAVHNNRWGIAPSLAIGLGHPTRAIFDYYHIVDNNLPDSGTPYNNPNVVAPDTNAALGQTQLYKAGDGEPISLSAMPSVTTGGAASPLANRNTFWGLRDRDKDRDSEKVATGRVEQDLFHGRALLRNTFRYERTEQNYIWTLPDDSKGNMYYGLLFRRVNDRIAAVFTDDNQTDFSGSFKTGKIAHTYATGMEFSKERGNNDAYTVTATTLQSGTATETCPEGAGVASGYNCTSLFSPNYNDPWTSVATNVLPQNHNPNHSSSVTQSAYGFDTIVFNKYLQTTIGGRYDHYDSKFSPAKSATAIAPQEVINNIGTYIVGVTYKPKPNTSVYGNISTAAIPPGNALAQGVDPAALSTAGNANLQPETIREEEFGVKREINNGRALVKVDIFREDIKNVRIANATGTVSVAGNNRTLGAEFGISGDITKRWTFTGGYVYLDAILLNGGTSTAGVSLNDQMMPNEAKHSVSVTSSYHIIKHLTAGGGIYGMTRVWGSQVNNKWVPGYVREDLFGNYEINKHFSLQANLQNLSNKLYFQQAYATHYAIPAAGRTAIFGINVKY